VLCHEPLRLFGESHSPVVHKLWVLVVAGSNPASPTITSAGNFARALENRARGLSLSQPGLTRTRRNHVIRAPSLAESPIVGDGQVSGRLPEVQSLVTRVLVEGSGTAVPLGASQQGV
jgi:hypothetical protein